MSFLLISGCVEVTPPTGTQNASAFASVGSGGNLTSGLEKRTPVPYETSATGNTLSPVSSGSPTGSNTTPGPDGKLPTAPSSGIVQVTPKSYEGLPQAAPTQSFSAKSNTSSIGPGEELVPIYNFNHSFVNDAIAYAYVLEKPPLFIDLQFAPVMGQDVISYQKRTGDKEGQLEVTVNRPLKDAWFEIRVYDQKDGSEVLREGYGKTFSQSNKTVALRAPGSYQFDMVGNFMYANISLKVPRSLADLTLMQNVNDLISTQKDESGKIKAIYLTMSDLPAGWEGAGDIIRTETNYQSMFKLDAVTLRQKINKYESTDKAIAELNILKTALGSDSTGPSLIGQQGFIVDKSQIKTQLVFVEGLYLVELSSFTPPNPVSVDDLKGYGKVIITRINSV